MSSRDEPETYPHLRKADDASVLPEDHCWCHLCLHVVLAIITAPYRRTFKLYTWKPLKEMRAARGDRGVLIPLIRQWKAEKYEELRSVQVSVGRSSFPRTKTDYRRLASVLELPWLGCLGRRLRTISGSPTRSSSPVFSALSGPSSLRYRQSQSSTIYLQRRILMSALRMLKSRACSERFCDTSSLQPYSTG